MEYARAIVDELGDLVEWCCNLEDCEIDGMLERHPEWYITTIAIG